jgi:hypothetical protein
VRWRLDCLPALSAIDGGYSSRDAVIRSVHLAFTDDDDGPVEQDRHRMTSTGSRPRVVLQQVYADRPQHEHRPAASSHGTGGEIMTVEERIRMQVTGQGPVARELARLLADTFTLYRKTQGHRWNNTGPASSRVPRP